MKKNEKLEYDVRDISLAPEGHRKIQWVKEHMPILAGLEEEFSKTKPFEGVKVSLSIHFEAKTAYLCKVLVAGGAELRATGSNVLSTKDDVAAALADSGVSVFAHYNATQEEYYNHLLKTLEHKPNIVIDDGGDLISILHKDRPDLAEETWGGCEETTTGIIRLKAMDKAGMLMFPMLAVNDADCKHLFDNRYGTGQSVWDAIMRTTNLIIAGTTVVVGGYGWCSKGIAMRASALGAKVIVTEINPVKAIEAKMDGYDVMKMEDAALLGDFFVTATGCADTISLEHMKLMKNNAICCNAGHFDVEVDINGLRKVAREEKEVRENLTRFVLDNGKCVNIICQGRLVNIAAADGHPAEIMDLSFAVQALSALYILNNKGQLPNKLIDVSEEIDGLIAKRKLESWGIKIDELTKEQDEYLNSWKLD